MNVLLINYEFPPVGGGAANATWELARAFVQLGHRPFVLTAHFRDRRPADVPDGVTLIEVPACRRRREACTPFEMATFTISASLRIRRMLRRESIDGMIAFFSIPCGPIAWWGARGTGVPYVVSLRGGDVPGTEPGLNRVHRLLAPLREAVFRRAQAIVTNSSGLRGLAEKADRFPVHIVPNGIDTDFFRPPDVPLAPLPFRVLFVGRFQPQKNLLWLLEELATLKASGLKFEVNLVGDGPMRAVLRSRATELGIESLVTWHGWLDRPALRALYQNCHCLVTPSVYEGMPNVVLEAVACGLAVIGSDVPGNHELLENSGAGELFPRGDAAEFRRLLTRRLTFQIPVGIEPGRLLHFTDAYSWLKIARSYLSFFEKPAGGNRLTKT